MVIPDYSHRFSILYCKQFKLLNFDKKTDPQNNFWTCLPCSNVNGMSRCINTSIATSLRTKMVARSSH